MTILEKLDEEIKKALKSKDPLRLSAVRLIKSSAKNKEIEIMHPLSDAEFNAVLSTLAKRHRESIEQFSKGGRPDLEELEKKQLEIVESYLPKKLNEDELMRLIDDAIIGTQASGAKDMGKVMKVLKDKTAGRVEGQLLAEKVRQRLAK